MTSFSTSEDPWAPPTGASLCRSMRSCGARRSSGLFYYPNYVFILTCQTNEFYHHREARNAPKVRMKSKIKQLVEPFSDIVPGKVGNICKTSQEIISVLTTCRNLLDKVKTKILMEVTKDNCHHTLH